MSLLNLTGGGTMTAASGSTTVSIVGLNIGTVKAGMTLHPGSAVTVGSGYAIVAVTPSGSNGGVITVASGLATDYTDAPFLIDTRAYAGDGTAYAAASLTRVITMLSDMLGLGTAYNANSKLIELDKATAEAVSRVSYKVAGVNQFAIEQVGDALILKGSPDGTAWADAIQIGKDGAILLPSQGAPTDPQHPITLAAADSRYVRLSGGTVSGVVSIEAAAPYLEFRESDQTGLGAWTRIVSEGAVPTLRQLDDAGANPSDLATFAPAGTAAPAATTVITREKGDARYAQLGEDATFAGVLSALNIVSGDGESTNPAFRLPDGASGARGMLAASDDRISFVVNSGLAALIDAAGTATTNAASIITREKGDARYAQLAGRPVFTATGAQSAPTIEFGHRSGGALGIYTVPGATGAEDVLRVTIDGLAAADFLKTGPDTTSGLTVITREKGDARYARIDESDDLLIYGSEIGFTTYDSWQALRLTNPAVSGGVIYGHDSGAAINIAISDAAGANRTWFGFQSRPGGYALTNNDVLRTQDGDARYARLDAHNLFYGSITVQRSTIPEINWLNTSISSSEQGSHWQLRLSDNADMGFIARQRDGGGAAVEYYSFNARWALEEDASVVTRWTGDSRYVQLEGYSHVYIGMAAADSWVTQPGHRFMADGRAFHTGTGQTVIYANRIDNGTVVSFVSNNTTQGYITISGSTVSYGSFTGSHWSQLLDHSRPGIPRGTVMETIDAMCVWPDEANEQLAKSQICDTPGSTRVYGVFMAWDTDDLVNNDLMVVGLGAFVVRMAAGETPQGGDLIEAAGGGCARVQAGSAITAATIGKITSPTPVETYSDGSFTVPCVLYCG